MLTEDTYAAAFGELQSLLANPVTNLLLLYVALIRYLRYGCTWVLLNVFLDFLELLLYFILAARPYMKVL